MIVVAHGMGGHQEGDDASRITVDTVVEHVRSTLGDDPRERLYIGVEQAHTAVRTQALRAGTLDMGCTVVAVFIQQGKAFVAHVGDSRLYFVREGRVAWVTRDHTRVRFLLDAGLLSAEDAEGHPESNVITRAVGHEPADLDGGFVVDVMNQPLELREGDSLLLCSDGLYDMVGEVEILSLLSDCPAGDAVERLVERANQFDRGGNPPGGFDNITVAVVNVGVDRGSAAASAEDDTVELGPESEGNYIEPPAEGPLRDEVYRPAYSTLVPEATLNDATMTLPEDDFGSAEPGVGTGTEEMTMTRAEVRELQKLADDAASRSETSQPLEGGSSVSSPGGQNRLSLAVAIVLTLVVAVAAFLLLGDRTG